MIWGEGVGDKREDECVRTLARVLLSSMGSSPGMEGWKTRETPTSTAEMSRSSHDADIWGCSKKISDACK